MEDVTAEGDVQVLRGPRLEGARFERGEGVDGNRDGSDFGVRVSNVKNVMAPSQLAQQLWVVTYWDPTRR